MITHVRKLITPEEAQCILDNNYEHNRTIKITVASAYAASMEAGDWDADCQDMISISDSGKLLNGQHRMLAVVLSRKPQWFWVALNVPESAYKCFDNGAKRTAADYLINVPDAKNVAAVAKIALCIEMGNSPLPSTLQGRFSSFKGTPITPSRLAIADFASRNADRFYKYHRMADKVVRRSLCGNKATVAAAICFIDDSGTGESLSLFVDEVGSPVPSSQPAKYFQYSAESFRRRDKRIDKETVFYWFVRCYEAFVSEEPVNSLNKKDQALKKYQLMLEGIRKDTTNI